MSMGTTLLKFEQKKVMGGLTNFTFGVTNVAIIKSTEMRKGVSMLRREGGSNG